MSAITEVENNPIGVWAYNEIASLQTGSRQILEPILPHVYTSFDLIDAQIAEFITNGYTEQARIVELIDEVNAEIETLSSPPELPTPPQDLQPTMLTGTEMHDHTVADVDLFFMENDKLLFLDTHDKLPELVLDPRDGGNYTSEIPAVQAALDVLQAVQDQIPTPIQSTANDIYDKLTGGNHASDHGN